MTDYLSINIIDIFMYLLRHTNEKRYQEALVLLKSVNEKRYLFFQTNIFILQI